MHDPSSLTASALVVIDYQNDFCHSDGALAQTDPSAVRPAAEIHEQVAALLEAARGANIPRIFVRVAHSEWTDTPAWTNRGSGDPPFQIPLVREGTWGADFYRIRPRQDELVITKHRYSAFLYTPLELVLQAKRVESIIVAGVQTDVCVHATARDAMQYGFAPIVVEDCVATRDANAHGRALDDIRTRIGRVSKLVDVQTALS